MSPLPRPVHEMSAAELIAEADRRAANRAAGRPLDAPAPLVNGIALGPQSPLLPAIARTRPAVRAKRQRAPGAPTEHDIQVELFARITDPAEQLRRPALALAFAVPNGGRRTIAVAGKLKAEGVKPGVPDIWLPVARGGYHGLVLELKRPGGATSPEQAHWLAALAREGWRVALQATSGGAWDEIVAYLDQDRSD